MEAKKRFYTEGSRSFIEYNGKPRMIIEVFEIDTSDDIITVMAEKGNEMKLQNLPYFGAATSWNGKYYLLVSTSILDALPPSTKQYTDHMARVMRRLADWYRYTILKAQAN
jgi:hypothetical protein